ncbi:MAG: helix-turn-helix domain-containing protein [Euryarchaeota archaeon]|jgi:uncharacterized protein (TIGR00270 family)|nr:helix-turn-helix domain-containing protein [Euryarchaeota archaeon]MBT3757517.1 helix-turn-helix domain-containing protein [Euryarchaeota archaeon]MBT4050609.1 helix-turn-helix domain-containing protein [Euryarchaeota archaeon]MBT4650741.1 helix-turn-helix domain-containing protein [Euryarchaeota archaeon]MBT4961702.1 helix-turn-helix domain-containing protein [Euryarchaeota archaeon]|tara:strand:+ start:7802 stop:8302 length:501 start_codon:yes stop_codon:yes gene_type:complete
MGTCELCGAEKISTRRANAAGIKLEACNRCIDNMNLKTIESPIQQKQIIPKQINNVTSRGVSGKDIMAKHEKELAPDFHKRIRDGRLSKGWDQRTFALKMNERLNSIQKIENGGRPTDSLISKIEKILEIDLYIERSSQSTSMLASKKRGLTIGDALEDLLSRRDE